VLVRVQVLAQPGYGDPMQLNEFKLERYFAAYEFNVEYILSASDPESLSQAEVLALARPEARRLWDGLSLGYTESQGHPLLRREIAELYTTITPDDVLALVPEEGIFLAMQALLKPGDHVVAIAPAYQSLHEVARGLGCQVTPWPLSVQEGRWQLDVDFLATAVTPQTRLIIVNFPHNPTGYLPSPVEQGTVVEFARTRGLYLFSDEMYRGLEYDPGQQLPAACDLYERAISLAGLSKSYGLPGLRTGWLATRDREVLAACARLKDYTTICGAAPAEILALMALQARDEILARHLARLAQHVPLARDFCSRHADLLTWLPPAAGTVAFPALDPAWAAEDFCNALLAAQSVLLAPASVFDYPGNHVRLGLGRANFPLALARVERFLDEKGLRPT
jgi:aspartate/methionine/tyrosine aminotransferase